MLVIGWGGKNTAEIETEPWLNREIWRSTKEINALGIIHKDLRHSNVLWNKELGQMLIIDFHRASLHTRSLQRPRSKKRKLRLASGDVKSLRLKQEELISICIGTHLIWRLYMVLSRRWIYCIEEGDIKISIELLVERFTPL